MPDDPLKMTLKAQIRRIRRGIPVTRSGIFLNHTETTSMLTPVTEAMSSYLDGQSQAVNTTAIIEKSRLKKLIGKLIGAKENEMKFFHYHLIYEPAN